MEESPNIRQELLAEVFWYLIIECKQVDVIFANRAIPGNERTAFAECLNVLAALPVFNEPVDWSMHHLWLEHSLGVRQ